MEKSNKTSYIVQFHHLFTNEKSPKLFFDSPYLAQLHLDKPSCSMTATNLPTDYDRIHKIHSVLNSVRKTFGHLYIASIESIHTKDIVNKKISKYVLCNHEPSYSAPHPIKDDWTFLYNDYSEWHLNILNLPVIHIDDYMAYIEKIRPIEFAKITPKVV